MAMILTKAVAKMVRGGLGFKDVRGEFGTPGVLGTSMERLRRMLQDDGGEEVA